MSEDRESSIHPLTEAERAELRNRLLAEGVGSGNHLSLPEQMAYFGMGILRPDSDVDLLAHQARREAASRPEGPAYAQGILDAITWARGRWPGPMSGIERVGRPRIQEFEREEHLARSTLRQEAGGYAAGVEATLMWLRAARAAPPW